MPHFKDLKQKHEENVNTEAMRVEGEDKTAMAVIKLNHMRKRRDGSMDKEEEDYFDSDIDGDENNEASAMKAMKIMNTKKLKKVKKIDPAKATIILKPKPILLSVFLTLLPDLAYSADRSSLLFSFSHFEILVSPTSNFFLILCPRQPGFSF